LVISVENILNELSGIRELVGYIQDVTRRKEAELELNRLSLVATKTTNCVIITDKNRKITWANSSTTALTGYTFEEMVGKSPSMFQCEGTNPQTVKYIREKLSSNENIKCEILNRSKFGREYWLELNIVPLFDDDNEVYGYIAVETDITQIKETSMELAEREMQLRNILDNASEMIHTLDANGNVLWANKSWMRNLEVDEQKLSEINLLNLLDDATKEEFMQVMPALKNGKSVEDLNCGFFSISGKHLNLRGITIPLFEAGVFIGSQAYLHNVTEIVRAESELRRISSLQEVIMSYSNQFISSSWAESFEIVSGSLGALGRILGVSRICLESLSQREIAFNTSWKEKGDDSLQLLGLLPENVREEFFNELKDKGFIQLNMNDIAGFIPEVVRRDFGSIWMFGLLNSQGISSILSLGLPENINLNDSEIELIRLYCQMIVNLENRFRFLQQVESAKKEIEAINTSLESKVLENTKRNLELSKLVVEHEKLATIGEFSAGIAHDLNTPLGAIKSGSESLRYSLKALSDKLRELNIEQFELILDLAKAIGKSSYLSGMQFAREVKSARQYLTDHFTDRYAKVSGIEEMLVRCRIPLTDHVTVERILRFENPVLFLEALDHAQNIYSLLEILDVSVERAGSVVKTMRSFVKKDTSEKSNLKWIRLHENISVVLNIFSFELRRNVETVFECPQNIRIEGFDVKLFQLWSNLIKNALEAMDGMENKRLEIRAHSENGRVYVEVANNGPVIPEEARIQIFKKFYSTKKHKSGTGLGLSIVQNIAEEHGATIRLESSEERTSFILTFSKVKED
jgi:PAS domain S-box-containing protein